MVIVAIFACFKLYGNKIIVMLFIYVASVTAVDEICRFCVPLADILNSLLLFCVL